MESKKRSLVKLLSWRVIGLIIWPIVSYIITGDLVMTGWLTGVFVSMTGIYYIHERIWDKIKWGRD